MSDKKITIRQTKSPIKQVASQRMTLKGLGLNRIGRTRQLPDTPEVRGMIRVVKHLIEVVE